MAQRQLGKTTDTLSSVFERLSSGMRINHASDDAAGLAISTSLAADTRVYTQGVRNIGDGVSTINIVQGALTELTGIVTRQKELAEQAANGVYISEQRVAMQKESDELTKEFNRIIATTSFNGMKLMDGTYTSGITIQAGYGTSGSISFAIGSEIARNQGNGTFTQVQSASFAADFGATISLGDINGDGRADMAQRTYNRINIFLANSDGTFSLSQTFAGDGGNSTALADLDSDGDLDLVTGEFWGPQVMLNNGNGSFRAASYIGSQPTFVGGGQFTKIADVNGDGRLDLVGLHVNGGDISIRLGNGDGTFKGYVTQTVAHMNRNFELADVNGDGRADIISTQNSAGPTGVTVALANADGSFAAATTIALAGQAADKTLAYDIDRDGKLDLLTTTGTSIVFHKGNGDGTFKATQTVATGFSSLQSINVGDLNGDGFLDYSGADFGTNQIITSFGNGDGTFLAKKVGAALTFGTTTTASLAWDQISLGDTNGDGAADLVIADGNVTGGGANQFFVLKASTTQTTTIGALNLATQQGARTALGITTNMLDKLALEVGKLGASMSRLSIASNNLMTAKENFSAAHSRINDADIAEESAQLVAARIRQQAAASVLQQANLQPQLVLTLLKS